MKQLVLEYQIPLEEKRLKHLLLLKEKYEPSHELKKQLIDFIKKRIENFKGPKEIEFVKELPKTVTGKILRLELKKREFEKTRSS
ncbi:MAG: hypothetical protein ACFFDI_11305 [Promethearchaeota archaeon]